VIFVSSERTPKLNQRSQRQNRQRRDNQRNDRKNDVGMAAPRGGDLDQLHQASGCHFGQTPELAPRSEGRSPALMGKTEPRRPPSIGGKRRPAWQSRRGRVAPQGKRDPASWWKGSGEAAQAKRLSAERRPAGQCRQDRDVPASRNDQRTVGEWSGKSAEVGGNLVRFFRRILFSEAWARILLNL
jgi:hypothetical protein